MVGFVFSLSDRVLFVVQGLFELGNFLYSLGFLRLIIAYFSPQLVPFSLHSIALLLEEGYLLQLAQLLVIIGLNLGLQLVGAVYPQLHFCGLLL